MQLHFLHNDAIPSCYTLHESMRSSGNALPRLSAVLHPQEIDASYSCNKLRSESLPCRPGPRKEQESCVSSGITGRFCTFFVSSSWSIGQDTLQLLVVAQKVRTLRRENLRKRWKVGHAVCGVERIASTIMSSDFSQETKQL